MPLLLLGSLLACHPAPPVDTADDSVPVDTADSGSSTDSVESGESAETGDSVADVVHPNWVDDVAPIVYDQCVSCHRAGGIGPFPLETWADMAGASNNALLAMQAGTMPPFLVDNSGECQTFREARVVTPEQLAMIEQWITLGMPEGEGALPAAPVEDELDHIDGTLDPGEDYTPDLTGGDRYRCIPVEWGFSGEKYLTAYTTHPGQPSIVHHVTIYTLYDLAGQMQLEELDAADPGPGYDCDAGPLVENMNLVAVWNPGTGVTRLPGESGTPVNGDFPGFIRLHYAGTSDDLPDRTTVDVQMEDSVKRIGYMVGLNDGRLALQPGLEAAVATSDYTLADFGWFQRTKVWGVNPHMHTRGYAQDVWLDPDTAPECVERLAYWDYGWQQMFWFTEPLVVDPEQVFRLTCTYDTRGETDVIHFGQTSTSEMCLSILYVTPE